MGVPMPNLTDKQRRAVEMLVRQPDACSERQLLARGFSFNQLAGLLCDGYATVVRKHIDVGGREKSVPWLQITDSGRRAMAGGP
jgi:hypothetical protein